MHDELLQFQRMRFGPWYLDRRVNTSSIQMEGVDYDETFAPVARMESIKILLALACQLKFKLYQMDVKTTFLNGLLKEDV